MRILPILLFLPTIAGHWLKCISIYGLETEARDFVCSWKNDVSYYIQQVHDLGFNTLRLPFSYQYVQEGRFDRMDHFMQQSFLYNMSVILDYHRVWSNHQGPDPFEGGLTMDQFINMWKTLLYRYNYFPNLEHINSYNEYQGSNASFVNEYSSTLFSSIEESFPNRFSYWMTGINWAGSLVGINIDHLPFKSRIGYSVHKYPFSGTADKADWDYTIPLSLDPERVIIGEWGWMETIPSQVDWVKRFIPYLKSRKLQHTCYWTIAHSHDTGNMWEDSCDVVKWDNFKLIKTLWDDVPQNNLRKNK
jgi:hypothetical protein